MFGFLECILSISRLSRRANGDSNIDASLPLCTAFAEEYKPGFESIDGWVLPRIVQESFQPTRRYSSVIWWTAAENVNIRVDGYILELREFYRPLMDDRFFPQGLKSASRMKYWKSNTDSQNEFFTIDELNGVTTEIEQYWSNWGVIFNSTSRIFDFDKMSLPRNPNSGSGFIEDSSNKVLQFRLRAYGYYPGGSQNELASTVFSPCTTSVIHYFLPNRNETSSLSPVADSQYFEIIGTGINNAMGTRIRLGHRILFDSMSGDGLVLIVLSKVDLAVSHMKLYDSFRSIKESDELASKLSSIDSRHFILIASVGRWELNASVELKAVLERCGAFHFGTWAGQYTNSLENPEYWKYQGHPYAFIGSGNIGAGNGYESIQLNTGHYMQMGKAMRAIVRGVLKRDEFLGFYHPGTVFSSNDPFFITGVIPSHNTIHNPWPVKAHDSGWDYREMTHRSPYSPYIGTLSTHLDDIMSAYDPFLGYSPGPFRGDIIEFTTMRPTQSEVFQVQNYYPINKNELYTDRNFTLVNLKTYITKHGVVGYQNFQNIGTHIVIRNQLLEDFVHESLSQNSSEFERLFGLGDVRRNITRVNPLKGWSVITVGGGGVKVVNN